MSKYGHRTGNWHEAIVNKLGGEEAADRFLRGENTVSKPPRSWREQDGVIYFLVTSDGTTGPAWIKRLEKKSFGMSDYTKSVLCSPDFKPTTGVMTIAVLKGILFKNNDRVIKKIRAEADRRNLIKPNAEVACLIRENLSDEEIKVTGLGKIIVMHEPIKGSDGGMDLLCVNHFIEGHALNAYADSNIDVEMLFNTGFAFILSQVGSQS